MTNSDKNALTVLMLGAALALALILVSHGLVTQFGILTSYGFAAVATVTSGLSIAVVAIMFTIGLTRYGLDRVSGDVPTKFGWTQIVTCLAAAIAFVTLGAALAVAGSEGRSFLDPEVATGIRQTIFLSAIFPALVIARGQIFRIAFPLSYLILVSACLSARGLLRLSLGSLAEILMGTLVILALCWVFDRALKALRG